MDTILSIAALLVVIGVVLAILQYPKTGAATLTTAGGMTIATLAMAAAADQSMQFNPQALPWVISGVSAFVLALLGTFLHEERSGRKTKQSQPPAE